MLRAVTLLFAAAVLATAARAEDAIPYWREQLSAADPEARAAAARGLELLRRQAVSAVPDLIAALADPEPAVRRAVIEALSSVGAGASAAIPALADVVVADPDPEARRLAARALSRFGRAGHVAIPVLVERGLVAPDPDARALSCDVLGSLDVLPQAVVRHLVEVLARDPDSAVRQAARSALKQVRADMRAHADLLIAALGDGNPDVRENAAGFLGGIRPAVPEAVDPLVTVALDDPVSGVRKAATGALRAMGPSAASAIPRLVLALERQGRDQRETSASVLGSIGTGSPDVVAALMAANLDDRELGVRLAARGALVRLARTDDGVFHGLIEAAGGSGEVSHRAGCIDVLGRLGEDAAPAVTALLVALRDGTGEVREAAAQALGRIGHPAFDALLPLRRAAAWDRSQRVRDAADRAIKSIRTATELADADAPSAEPGEALSPE